ncbi:MAG: hypothetical protein CL734_00835 [Chloroflexi bacterium]|nr:hypothetical protein [Chloroflexota bacterium]
MWRNLIHVIAHRGYSSERPENTFASFDHAIDSGCKFLELDIHLSKDHIPVVIHDSTVDRTTNGSGNISTMTYSEIESLDAGSWFDPAYGDQIIPTLEQVLLKYKDICHIVIEIKSEEIILIEKLRELLLKLDLLKDQISNSLEIPGVSVISFVESQVLLSKKYIPEIPHGLLMINPTQDLINFCIENEISGFFPYFKMINLELVKSVTGQGLHIGAWGLENVSEIEDALKLGLQGVTVDWPGQVDINSLI